MAGWLPEGYQQDRMQARAEGALAGVKARAVRHARRVRAARWTAGALFVTVLAFVLAPKVGWHELRPVPGGQVAVKGGENVRPAPPGPIVSEPTSQRANEPTRDKKTALPDSMSPLAGAPARATQDVTLTKADHGVELNWEGDRSKEYVIYRCTTPTFTQCAVAGLVKGTKWTDREASSAPVVFYKVEPKA